MRKAFFIQMAVLLLAATGLKAQMEDTLKVKPSYHDVSFYVEDNEACLKCHGENSYVLTDTFDRRAIKRMAPCKTVERDAFYGSVHKSFGCTDCHDYEFNTFPHTMETRFQEHLLCMDCHGYDETYAHYNFEAIEMESAEGVHSKIEGFSCWSCHDPHSYKAFMRNASDLRKAISYDNNMCLSCHSDFAKFSSLSDRDEIALIESHDWLPNQAAHFAKVRCIECHTEVNDTVFIAHKILPKSEAVQNCTECHSRDSRLMHTLYKFQSQENSKSGFMNGRIIRDSYVIGANSNIWLNWLSFAVLGMMLLVIGLHIYLRIKNQKTN